MTTYQQLEAIKAELAGARSEFFELSAALDDLRAEILTLEGARDVDLASLPVADMRVAIADSARAASDLPVLRRSVRELEKRVNSTNVRVSLLDRQRRRLEAAVAGEQAAGMLVTSKELAGALRVLDEASTVWPSTSAQGSTAIGNQMYTARREIDTLLKTALAMGG